jgi:multicomponent Na+:H+ antiporter subunit D
MRQQLPAIVFLLPLVTAICTPIVSLKNGRLYRPMALAAVGAMAVAAVVNLFSVFRYGEIRYAFGGWAPPIGIEWVADELAAVMAAALSVVGLICLIYSGQMTPPELEKQGPAIYTLILLLLAGLTGIVFAGDLFNIFVFLEVAALAGYALVGVAGGKALVSAFRYLILGALGASLYLLGVGYFYAVTGTLNMADLAQRVPEMMTSKAVIVGLSFMFIGLGIKMALMPLHGWLPDAYTLAPSAVSPILASLLTKVSLLAWIRIVFWVVGGSSDIGALHILDLLWILGALASLAGAFLALTQQNLKRMFAYGGVSHIGVILIGIGQGSQTGLVGGLFYLINDAVMQATLFAIAGVAIYQYGVENLDDAAVLRRGAPWMLAWLIISAMSMIGLPPTGGFFAKWYIVLSAIESGNFAAVVAIAGSTLLTMAYFMRLFGRIFRDEKRATGKSHPHWPETPLTIRVSLGALVSAIIALGVWSDTIVNALTGATRSLGL